MSGITKKVRGLNQYLAEEEENKLEKLAESIPGFETREKAEKEQQYRIKAITKAVSSSTGSRRSPRQCCKW